MSQVCSWVLGRLYEFYNSLPSFLNLWVALLIKLRQLITVSHSCRISLTPQISRYHVQCNGWIPFTRHDDMSELLGRLHKFKVHWEHRVIILFFDFGGSSASLSNVSCSPPLKSNIRVSVLFCFEGCISVYLCVCACESFRWGDKYLLKMCSTCHLFNL